MDEKHLLALLLLAGIEHSGMHEIANQYWPDVHEYYDIRRKSPWWLVVTAAGIIKIGLRKRVISIDWSATKVRNIVTLDDVTKREEYVHAWNYAKAVEYLSALNEAIKDHVACDGKKVD